MTDAGLLYDGYPVSSMSVGWPKRMLWCTNVGPTPRPRYDASCSSLHASSRVMLPGWRSAACDAKRPTACHVSAWLHSAEKTTCIELGGDAIASSSGAAATPPPRLLAS